MAQSRDDSMASSSAHAAAAGAAEEPFTAG